MSQKLDSLHTNVHLMESEAGVLTYQDYGKDAPISHEGG